MKIAISGTPCTGKSSVSRILAKRLGWRLIELNRLAEQKNLFCGLDRKRRARIVDTGKIKSEAENIPGNLILDSHYSHDVPNDLTVVLRCNPGELRRRMEKKGWDKRKIEENVQAEIMEVCLDEARVLGRRIIEIDTTGKRPEIAAEKVISLLKQRKLWKGKSPKR